MTRRSATACGVALLASLLVLGLATGKHGEHGRTALPPCVLNVRPQNRALDVDPGLGEIRVTFDREMEREKLAPGADANFAWINHGNIGEFPAGMTGDPPYWEDGGRTCVLPVSLKPDTLYAVGVNSYEHTGFWDKQGRVAVPFVWVFRTRKGE